MVFSLYNKSSRNDQFYSFLNIRVLVAEISRMSTGITLLLPTRVIFLFCNAVNSFACIPKGRLPISSIKRVLPKLLEFSGSAFKASVKASFVPEKFTFKQDHWWLPCWLLPFLVPWGSSGGWISRASISFRFPFSPVIKCCIGAYLMPTIFMSCCIWATDRQSFAA